MPRVFKYIHGWYKRFERPISSLSLVGGFVFDAITLKRVDLFWENFWVIAHLVAVAVFIILINYYENKGVAEENKEQIHFWLINALQFVFGGLLSTFLVFYFRSTTLLVTWPFLVLLALAFIANESLKKHYARLTFQISFFYLSVFSFAIFLVPIFYHRIGQDVFFVSGILSLAILGLFRICFEFFVREKFRKERKAIIFSILGIYFIVNILYFLNLIPPIPLSLKDAGVYHSITRNNTGNYTVQSERTSWLDYFDFHENFHKLPNEAVNVYSAVFSPTLFSLTIVHEWQMYNENFNEWITTNRVDFPITGGRDGGYRIYSTKIDPSPGKWRVNIETADGQIIGRLQFNVIETKTKPILETKVKE
jgi:hypothetical protein